jgi:hypothetical protein
MKIFKLDKRYEGYDNFIYCAEFVKPEVDQFCEVRAWCWQTWGASKEYALWGTGTAHNNEHWSWTQDEYRLRIYIKTDKDHQWFVLRWSS